jgi:hypothetical protein
MLKMQASKLDWKGSGVAEKCNPASQHFLRYMCGVFWVDLALTLS